MRRWYNPDEMAPCNQPKEPDLAWSRILGAWAVLEMDFANPFIYGVDLDQVLDTRTWRWFRLRLIALLGNPASKLKTVLTQEVAGG